MTDQYREALEKAAQELSWRSEYHPDVLLKCSEGDHWRMKEDAFKAGHAWALNNPPPEWVRLVHALAKISREEDAYPYKFSGDERINEIEDIDVGHRRELANIARKALAAFDKPSGETK